MKKAIIAVAFTLASLQAIAQDAQPKRVQLTDSGGLDVVAPNGVDLALAQCQPLKGDQVDILAIQQKIGYLTAPVAHVRVVDGQCAGEEGWVGIAHVPVGS